MLAVVLSFDRFPLGLLGCYGNASVETPCLDRIAASSVVFDQHFGEDFTPTPAGHAWWSRCSHFARPGTDGQSRMPSLPSLLAAGGVESTWITEENSSPLVPLPGDASVVVQTTGIDGILQRGSELIETWTHQPKSRRLLWLKVGESAWDFRRLPEMEWDEEEQSLISDVLNAGVLGTPKPGWSAAHWEIYRELLELAVTSLDFDIKPLWEQIQNQKSDRRVLFLITSAQGMLLGSRAQLPTKDTSWVEDIVHLPLIGYYSSYLGGERHLQFTQTTDLPATLLDYFACPSPDGLESRSVFPIFLEEALPEQETLTFGCQGSWGAVRTRDFYFVRVQGDDPDEPQRLLFMKPEDTWDWHDVSAQEPEMTETLSEQLDKSTNVAEDQPPVSNELETKPSD
ncbi:MAG: hypothetical protein KDA84_13070 [Planctomycetaceae bacterium]|nr:hypothetical protein [Planctomycetaceae bacterium]